MERSNSWGVSPMRGTPHWSRAREWGVPPTPRRDNVWCDRSPHSPLLFTGRKEVDLEVEPKKKGGVKGRWFKIWIYFSLSYIWQALNDINFPQSRLVCPWQQLLSDPSVSLSRPMSLSLYFCCPIQQRGVTEWLSWAPGVHPPHPLWWSLHPG